MVQEKQNLKSNIIAFLFGDALQSASIAIPYAILTPLLLSKGLSLSNIASIQIFYSMAVLLLEYPSGILADRMDRKKLFICSNLFLILFFAIVLLQGGLVWLSLAWIIYGVSAALSSGTIDNDIINQIKFLYKKDSLVAEKISLFVRRRSQIYLGSMLLGSIVGSFFYFRIGYSIYLFSMGLVFLSSINILLFFRGSDAEGGERSPRQRNVISQVCESMKEMKDSVYLRIFLLLILISQIFFQAHFQFWQAYFLNKDIDESHLYMIYVFFQVLGIIVGFVPAHKISSTFMVKLSPLLLIILLPLIYMMDIARGFITLLPYSVFVSIFWTLVNYCNFSFRKFVSQENISSLTSLTSSVGRGGAIASLALVSLLVAQLNIVYVVEILFSLSLILLLGTAVFGYRTSKAYSDRP